MTYLVEPLNLKALEVSTLGDHPFNISCGRFSYIVLSQTYTEDVTRNLQQQRSFMKDPGFQNTLSNRVILSVRNFFCTAINILTLGFANLDTLKIVNIRRYRIHNSDGFQTRAFGYVCALVPSKEWEREKQGQVTRNIMNHQAKGLLYWNAPNQRYRFS